MRVERLLALNRYLDNELAGEEKQAFETLLAGDPELRAGLEEIRALDRAVKDLPLLPAPPVSIPATPPAPHPRWALWRPMAVRFNLPAWGMAVAAAALLAVGGVLGRTVGTRPLPPGEGAPPPAITAAAGSPASGTARVRLVYHDDQAASVAVAGNFNGWREPVPLRRSESGGYWSAELELSPGEYQYVFIIDGSRRELDLTTRATIEDDYGSRNSLLQVSL